MIEPTAQTSRLLTIAETMTVLGCSRKTVYRLFEAGRLQRVYLAPRAPRVPEADVQAFVASLGSVA